MAIESNNEKIDVYHDEPGEEFTWFSKVFRVSVILLFSMLLLRTGWMIGYYGIEKLLEVDNMIVACGVVALMFYLKLRGRE